MKIPDENSKGTNELLTELKELQQKYNSLESFTKTELEHKEKEKLVLEKLIDVSKEFIQFHAKTPDYEKIIQLMLEISGAKYASLNIFEENGLEFRTVGFAGNKAAIKKGIDLLGIQIKNKLWKHDEHLSEKTKDGTITKFVNLQELAGNALSKNIISIIEKTFHLGLAYFIKIQKEEKLLGDFILVFQKDETLQNTNFVELYAHEVGMFLDRYKVADSVRAGERIISAITEAAQDAILMMDSEGKISYWNPAAERILGYTRDEAIGKNLHALLMIDRFYEAHNNAYPLFQKTGKGAGVGKTLDLAARHKSGNEIKIQLSLSAIEIDNEWHAVGIIRDVTQYKLADMELKASKLRFQAMFTAAPLGIALIDSITGHIYEVNPQFAKIAGRSMEEMIQIDWMQITHPDDIQEDLDNMALLNAGKITGYKMQKRYLLANGGFIWINKTVAPVYTGNTNERRHLTMIEDITERKYMEEAVRKSEEKYRSLVETMTDGLYRSTHEGKFIEVNPAMVNILGYNSKEELLNIDIKSELYFAEEERESADLEQKLEEMAVFRLRKKDGSEIWVEDHGRHVLDENGNILYHEGALRDVTDRIKAEDAIRESEEKFKNSFQYSAIGMALISPEGKWLKANPMVSEMVGYTEEELQNMTFQQITHPDDLDADLNFVQQLLEGKIKTYSMEKRYIHKNGNIVWVLLSVSLMRDKMNHPIYFISQVNDISDRKKAEKKLKETNEELKKINHEKDKFFSIIAHDLKSPFNSILGFSEIIVEQIREKDYSEIEKYSEIILQSSERAMELLMNLMEWAQSQTGRMKFNPAFFDLAELIEELLPPLEGAAVQKAITFTKLFPRNAIVFGDKNMISTILRNLISNAIKFTFEGGKITITLKETSSGKIVSIRDTGTGISKEVQNKLFRIDENITIPGTRNERGTGLGLILCKEFVEKHNGKIWVESEEGAGSEFCFTIPSHLSQKINIH